MRKFTTLVALSCLAGSGQIQAAVNESSRAELYRKHTLIEVKIETKNWDKLRQQDPKGGRCVFGYTGTQYSWVKFESVTINGHRFTDVGARKKAWCGSESKSKPAFNLDFAKYNKDAEDTAEAVLGTSDMTLNNSIQDASYVRQCLAFRAFNLAGVPAPHCNYAHVTVNGKDMGIFVNLEPAKKPLFKRVFGANLGNVYEISGEDFENQYLYRNKAELDSFKDPEDESLNDIKKVISALDNKASLETIKSLIDVNLFVRFWATEMMLSHWDGLTGNNNNAYLSFPSNGKMQVMPWGTDQILKRTDGATTSSIYTHNNLAARLSEFPEIRRQLLATIDELLTTIWNEGAMQNSIDASVRAIEDSIKSSERGTFEWAVQELKNNLVARRGQLRSLVGSSPGANAEAARTRVHLQNVQNSAYCLNTQIDNGLRLNNVYTCDTHEDQIWDISPIAEGYFSLRNPKSGNCVNVRGSGDYTHTETAPCDIHADQSWKPIKVSANQYRYESRRAPGKCLAIDKAENKADAIIKSCNSGDRAQIWTTY